MVREKSAGSVYFFLVLLLPPSSSSLTLREIRITIMVSKLTMKSGNWEMLRLLALTKWWLHARIVDLLLTTTVLDNKAFFAPFGTFEAFSDKLLQKQKNIDFETMMPIKRASLNRVVKLRAGLRHDKKSAAFAA